MTDDGRPRRERAREQSEDSAPSWLLPQPTQTRNWLQRVGWARVGAFVTVLIGALGLLLTGIATYYGALVSRDQLEQAQEEAVHQVRSQASRIALWVEWHDSPHVDALHVMNRSPDPIYAVTVSFWVDSEDRYNHHQVVLTSMPPCSEITLRGDELRTPNGVKLPPGTLGTDARMQFADRGGVTWERRELGRLIQVNGNNNAYFPSGTTRVLAPTPTRASSCSDDGL